MIQPEIRTDGETWQYLWPDSGFAIGFDLVRERSDGLHAELWVGSLEGQQTGNGHLVWGTFNLSSPTARGRMATTLSSRGTGRNLKAGQWAEMLEYACVMTAQDFRRGEPILDLSEANPILTVQYLVEPLLPLGQTTTLSADGDSGKGWIALGIAMACRLGAGLPGGLKVTRQTNTLYLDWETSYDENVRRQEYIRQGFGVSIRPPGIFYRHMTRPLADDLGPIRDAISRRDIGLLVVDSAGPATGAELKESEPVIRFMAALRQLECTKLVLAHVSKETAKQRGSERGRTFGSVFYENLSRSVWEVRSETDDNPITLGFFHRKANMGRRARPFALSLAFDDVRHSASFSTGDINEAPSVAEHAPLSYRMLHALKRGQMNTEELAEELNATKNAINKAAKELSAKGRIIPIGGIKRGRGNATSWGLTQPEGSR